MATVDRTRRSPAFEATGAAFDAAIEAAIAGTPRCASGTTFVPDDLASLDSIRHYSRSGPVVVVDERGEERYIPRDRSREFAVAAVVVGVLIAWLIGRRP